VQPSGRGSFLGPKGLSQGFSSKKEKKKDDDDDFFYYFI